METEKVFIIGDIHGCLDMLQRLMDKIEWRPDKDRLIFLGDYIDRGKNPKGVVDYILCLIECSPHVECLVGNHEAVFLDYLNGKDRNLFFLNGGRSTLESYGEDKTSGDGPLVPQAHMDFYRFLKPFVELEDYYIVHAGFRPGVPLGEQSLEDMVWIREPFISSEFDFGKKVVFGHTPFQEPLVLGNKIGLDTGAVYGNMLTSLEVRDFKFHSVGRE